MAQIGIDCSASNEKLSISIIDSNIVAEMTLNSGADPANYGDSSAAILGIETREGNRARFVMLADGCCAASRLI